VLTKENCYLQQNTPPFSLREALSSNTLYDILWRKNDRIPLFSSISTSISEGKDDVQNGVVCKLTYSLLWSILDQLAPQALRPRGSELNGDVRIHHAACAYCVGGF